MEEFMFLGLRMNEGISEKQFEELFGQSIDEVYGEVLKKYLALDLLWRSNGRIGLTREGISISNVILSDFLWGRGTNRARPPRDPEPQPTAVEACADGSRGGRARF